MNLPMTTPDILNLLTIVLLGAATAISLHGPATGEKSQKSLPILAALLIATYAAPQQLAPWIASLALVIAISGLPRFRRG